MKRLLIVTDAWYPQINGVVRSLEQTAKALEPMGISVRFITPKDFKTLPMPGYSEISLALAGKRSVAKAMLANSFDSLHLATEGPLGWAARAVAIEKGWQFTTSLHTKFPEYLYERTRMPVRWSYAVLRRFHNAAAATLVTTQSQKEELDRWGIRNTHVWLRGVDTKLFAPTGPKARSVSDDWPRPLWLYVGRLAVEKNIDAFLNLDLPGTKVVVGSGPERQRLEGKHTTAKFLGAQQGEDLAAIYRSCDCFVFPSLTDTFGLVVVEALASGLPVAAYPVTGPKDIIDNPNAGVLDSDLKTACLEAVQRDREDARKLALEFTWEACTLRFRDALVTLDGQTL